jgi:hypothetical protein
MLTNLSVGCSHRQLLDWPGWSELKEGCDLKEIQFTRDKFGAPMVNVDAVTGRVTELRLAGRGLTGDFPQCIRKLGQLWQLILSNNKLTGELLLNMGSAHCLPELQVLHVNDNLGLGGEICHELMCKRMCRRSTLLDAMFILHHRYIPPYHSQNTPTRTCTHVTRIISGKKGADIFLFESGRRIRSPFISGVSLATEALPPSVVCFLLWADVPTLPSGFTLHPLVPALAMDAPAPWNTADTASAEPEHRCIREGIGSLCQHGLHQYWPHHLHPVSTPAEVAAQQGLCIFCAARPSAGWWVPWQVLYTVLHCTLYSMHCTSGGYRGRYCTLHTNIHYTLPYTIHSLPLLGTVAALLASGAVSAGEDRRGAKLLCGVSCV